MQGILAACHNQVLLAMSRKTDLLQSIQQLKREKNAIVLAHLYERLEVQDMADYQGDSLGLSQKAADTDADVIIFCGVHFMAETAKLLSPDKEVYLANPNAGCPMADMITAEQLQAFKARYPGRPVVGYVNTSAAVKAECDICCTSSNAVEVVRQLCEETGQNQILFVPDKHLGAYVQQQLPEVEVLCWDGFCPTHLRLELDDLKALLKAHPDATVMAHPECDELVKEHAHFIGSTTGIVQQAHACEGQTFIICTEEGISQKLTQELPHKTFLTPARVQAVCPNMKMTRLENVQRALNGQVEAITIAPDVFDKARQSIDRMMAVPAGPTAASAGSAACRCKSSPVGEQQPALVFAG